MIKAVGVANEESLGSYCETTAALCVKRPAAEACAPRLALPRESVVEEGAWRSRGWWKGWWEAGRTEAEVAEMKATLKEVKSTESNKNQAQLHKYLLYMNDLKL